MRNTKTTDLPVYKRIFSRFESGEFKLGKCKNVIYANRPYEKDEIDEIDNIDAGNLGAYAYRLLNWGKLSNVPEEYRTKVFFINTLSSANVDVFTYVKEHIDQFDREFFKNCIATDEYSIEFDENCFDLMPLEYIDEEMVACALMKTVKASEFSHGARNRCCDWFFTVARRKPEVLTRDFYILGAKLWAERRKEEYNDDYCMKLYRRMSDNHSITSTSNDKLKVFIEKYRKKNPFLSITPEEYKTEEYYYNMCIGNSTPVMEDFPEEILTASFLQKVFDEDPQNISSFSKKALEMTAPKTDKYRKMKFWRRAIRIDGWTIRDMPLDDRRIRYFKKYYDKEDFIYIHAFQNKYQRYLYEKKVLINSN